MLPKKMVLLKGITLVICRSDETKTGWILTSDNYTPEEGCELNGDLPAGTILDYSHRYKDCYNYTVKGEQGAEFSKDEILSEYFHVVEEMTEEEEDTINQDFWNNL